MASPRTTLNPSDCALASFPVFLDNNTSISGNGDNFFASTCIPWPSKADPTDLNSKSTNKEVGSDNGLPLHEIEIRYLRAQLEVANEVRIYNLRSSFFVLMKHPSAFVKYILSCKVR